MKAFVLKPIKLKRLLLWYWISLPAVFLVYLLVLSNIRHSTMAAILEKNQQILLTMVLVLLLFFQSFGLVFLREEVECKKSFLGIYLLINLIQQLLTGNWVGALLIWLFYRSLSNAHEEKRLSKREQFFFYLLVFFIVIISAIVFVIRFL